MWEIIRKNKLKSVIAFSIMTVWYCVVYGTICGISALAIFSDIADYNTEIAINLFMSGFIIALAIFVVRFLRIKNKPYKFGNYCIYKVSRANYKQLYNIVEEVAIASGISVIPNIYILNSNILNAYACGFGQKNSSIVISKRLLEVLSRDELQGVIAHEMSHVINQDTKYLLCSGALYAISATFTLFFKEGMRSRGKGAALCFVLFLLSLIGQGICFILFMFISRKREYLADACACTYTRYPKGLADALLKIENQEINYDMAIAQENSNTLVKASFIVPLKKNDSLISTHPATENRIKVLLNMNSADYKEYERAFQNLNNEKLIPVNTLQNSKRIKIKQVETIQPQAAIVAACSLGSAIKTEQEINTIKENKKVLKQNIEKHREVESFVRNLAGYFIINCKCGVKLSIPPVYKNQIVICPHCKKKHAIGAQ